MAVDAQTALAGVVLHRHRMASIQPSTGTPEPITRMRPSIIRAVSVPQPASIRHSKFPELITLVILSTIWVPILVTRLVFTPGTSPSKKSTKTGWLTWGTSAIGVPACLPPLYQPASDQRSLSGTCSDAEWAGEPASGKSQRSVGCRYLYLYECDPLH